MLSWNVINFHEPQNCEAMCTNGQSNFKVCLQEREGRDLKHFFHSFSLQLARHNKLLQQMLKPGSDPDDGDEALKYYANHTAQIEVTILS